MKGIFKNFGEETETVKAAIVKQFMKLSPKLKQYYQQPTLLETCDVCGEPASGDMCSACLILAKLKE